MYKLFVLDRNIWNHTTVSKLFVLDMNIWNHDTVGRIELFSHIRMVIILNCLEP